jgi:hypothetical protein
MSVQAVIASMGGEMLMWGCLGGLIPDTLRILAARHDGPPAFLFSFFFWLSLIILAALGGLVSYLLNPVRIIDALAIGYAAPGIISRALSKPGDETVVARGASAKPSMIGNVRSWWSR